MSEKYSTEYLDKLEKTIEFFDGIQEGSIKGNLEYFEDTLALAHIFLFDYQNLLKNKV